MNAFNFKTLTEYSGSNASLAGNGELAAFATFNQLKELGYMVKKGAKGVKISCGFRKVLDEATGKEKTVPKWAIVFDIIDTTANEDKEFLKWLKGQITGKKIKAPVLS